MRAMRCTCGARRCPTCAASNGVTVHPALGRISRRDLRAVDRLLDRFPPPRRLLVQWVPHGFGYRSMNVGFCMWLLRRARRGDRIEIMVHEPYLAIRRGWDPVDGRRVRASRDDDHPGARGHPRLDRDSAVGAALAPVRARTERAVRMAAHSEQSADAGARGDPARARSLCAAGGGPIVGHSGLVRHGRDARVVCEPCQHILQRTPNAAVVLLGQHGERFHQQLVRDHPQLAARIQATGTLSPQALADHIGACDLLIQPYPDGISSRRTSAMAGLALGIPVDHDDRQSHRVSLGGDARGLTRQSRRFTRAHG